ncbi:hypothetical protein CBL_03993 [Carabus blaptoides fortunei]
MRTQSRDSGLAKPGMKQLIWSFETHITFTVKRSRVLYVAQRVYLGSQKVIKHAIIPSHSLRISIDSAISVQRHEFFIARYRGSFLTPVKARIVLALSDIGLQIEPANRDRLYRSGSEMAR